MAGMHTGLSLNMHLAAKLTPQQVQLLKMLQMNVLQLEQHVRQELEQNPMLEEGSGENEFDDDYELTSVETLAEDTPLQEEYDSEYNADLEADAFDAVAPETTEIFNPENGSNDEEQTWVDFIEDEGNPPKYSNDDDSEGFPTPETRSLLDELEDQLRLLNLSEEEQIVAEEILGSIEPSGYLYRDLQEIVEAANEKIAALNQARRSEFEKSLSANGDANAYRHDYRYDYFSAYANKEEEAEDFESLDLSPLAARRRQNSVALPPATLKTVALASVERVLLIIQRLDPPGVGARDLRECLLAQLDALSRRNAAQQLAKLVLERCYEAFCKKHYDAIMRDLKVGEDYLREALQAIRALNPKPGGMESAGTSSVIPDFLISYDEKKDDFGIQLNDARVPTVYVNKTYEKMKNQVREATQRGMKSQKMNEGTRQFLKHKYDDAKFLLAALRQRRQTMIKVMTAIVSRQRDFFLHGKEYIRPLIYKDIAEDTGVDISTVCRVVNNKYAQTDFGVLELRYFFSEGMPMAAGEGGEQEDGAEVSTRVIKDKLREIIAGENKKKPFSDDRLVTELQKSGYDIARRTVAKYREQMQIPVARLRKEL